MPIPSSIKYGVATLGEGLEEIASQLRTLYAILHELNYLLPEVFVEDLGLNLFPSAAFRSLRIANLRLDELRRRLNTLHDAIQNLEDRERDDEVEDGLESPKSSGR